MYTNFLLHVTQHSFQFLLDAITFVVSFVTVNKTKPQPINKPIIHNFKFSLYHYFIEQTYVIMPVFFCYTAVLLKVNMRTAVPCYV